jgi:DNA-binding CsgD family transcriptional regulator/tetratricopeptide (TPR) repeat protein
LLYAARRLDRPPALLIATYRDDEIGTNTRLTSVVGELSRLGATRRVPVPPLTASGVASLVAGCDLNPAEVFHQTAGNAFFVSEMVAARSSKPATVRDVVLARAARLSPQGRHVLDVASQLGVRFDASVLIEASGTAAAGVDDCIAAGMLVSYVDELGFRHELSRATIADELAPIRRASVNGAILRVLEARRGSDIARLATHAAAAHEADAAFRYGIQAGERAAGLASHREAVHHYRTALRFASQRPDRDRAALYDQLAAECMVIDEADEALVAAEEALRLWESLGDPLRIGAAHMSLDRACWYLARGEEAQAHAAAAVAVLEPHGPSVEYARALAGAAASALMHGDPDRTIDLGRRAVEVARAAGDVEADTDALNTIGYALLLRGDLPGALTHLERSLQIALEAGHGHHAGRAYANLASALADNSRWDRADAVLADGMRCSEDHELTTRYLCLTGVLAGTELARGRWDDALANALCVLDRAGSMSVGRLPALITISTIKLRRGDADAQPMLRETLRLAECTTEVQQIAPVRLALAEAAWLRGDAAAARVSVEATLADADGAADPHTLGRALSWLTRLGAPRPVPAIVPRELAFEIDGQWAEAAGEWEALERPYERALALIQVGSPEALTEAFAILDRLGARPAAAIAAAGLRTLGGRAPRGPRPTTRTNPAGLTAREVEVLRLIADCRQTPKSLARLYISDKTVEHHVSRILAKLEVPSRRDAARAARDLALAATQTSRPSTPS